ncbi:hypothetical protein D3C79_615160 [compost metagenome]
MLSHRQLQRIQPEGEFSARELISAAAKMVRHAGGLRRQLGEYGQQLRHRLLAE